jgi:glucuronoxylan 4-O-methyltransferase
MQLPERIRDHRWDVILVDAPPGDGPGRPGRMQSIYEASRLAAPDACVFVHDIDRPVEKWFSTRFLGRSIDTVHRLGVFGTRAKLPRR